MFKRDPVRTRHFLSEPERVANKHSVTVVPVRSVDPADRPCPQREHPNQYDAMFKDKRTYRYTKHNDERRTTKRKVVSLKEQRLTMESDAAFKREYDLLELLDDL